MADRRLRLIIEAQNKAQAAFAQVEGNLQKLNSKIVANNKSFEDSFGALTSKLQSTGQAMTLGLTAPLVLLGTAAYKTYAEMDSLKRGMIAVTGSAAKATLEMVKLREVAKLPGLGFKEALQGSINLQAAGASADSARKYLMAFGNAIATVGGGKADLDGVNLALTQLMNRTSGFGQEIRQLQERLPQIRQIMMKTFGTADSEAIGKMGITGKQFVDAIANEFAKLPKMLGGPKNDLENLADAWNDALDAMGKTMAPVMTKAIKHFSEMAEKLADLNPRVKTFAVYTAGIGAATGPAILGLNQLIIFLGSVRNAYNLATAAATRFKVSALGAIGVGLSAIAITSWNLSQPNTFEKLSGVAKEEQDRAVKVIKNRDKAKSLESQRFDALVKLQDMAPGPEKTKAFAAVNAKYEKMMRDAKNPAKKNPVAKMAKAVKGLGSGFKMPKVSDVAGDPAEDGPTLTELSDERGQKSLQWLEDSLTLDEITIKEVLAGVERLLDKKNKMYASMSRGFRATLYAKRKEIMTTMETERADKLDSELDALIKKQEDKARRDAAEVQKARERIANYYDEQQAGYEMSAIAAEGKGDALGASLTRNFAKYQQDLEAVAKIGRTGADVTKQRALVDAKRSASDRSATQSFAKNIWDRVQAMRQEADEYVLNIQRQIEADRERERSRIRWTNSESLWRNANIQGASTRLSSPLPFYQLQNNGSDPTAQELAKAREEDRTYRERELNKLDAIIAALGIQPEGAAF
jgi:tape measure domain-containing protein